MYQYDLNINLIALEPWQRQIFEECAVPDGFDIHLQCCPNPVRCFSAQDIHIVRLEEDWCETFLKEFEGIRDQRLILIAAPQLIKAHHIMEACQERILEIWHPDICPEQLRFHVRKLFNNIKLYCDSMLTSQYLESILQATPNMIWFKDKEGIHVKVNDAFCRTVNKEMADVENRDHNYIWDVSEEEAAGNDCMESDRAVMESRQTCINEEVVKAGDSFKILTTFKSPVYDLNGRVIGTSGIGVDITQERAYQQEVEKKNQVLETIFASVDCGILCHSMDGKRIISCNNTALYLLGYANAEEMMKDHFTGIASTVIKEDQEKLWNAMRSVKRIGDSANVEYRVRHKDGEIRHIMGSVKLLEDNGETYYHRFLLDVTAQRMQEKENERFHNELIHALTIDYDYAKFVNLALIDEDDPESQEEGHDEALPFKLKSVHNTLFSEDSMDNPLRNMCEEDRKIFEQVFLEGDLISELEKKNVYYMNFRTCHNDQVCYNQIKAVRSGIWDEHVKGAVIGIRSVDDEIRKEMEQRILLETALTQAQSANKAKTIFLSNMSHDIRTPMNAILGFSSLALAQHQQHDDLHDYLEKIRSSGNILLKLINDILDMSSIESGRFQLNEERFQMQELMSELRNICLSSAYDKHLHMVFDTDSVEEDWVDCDRLRIHQALMNVLGNATKYTDQGGTVIFHAEKKPSLIADKDNYIFTIEDNGIGMSEAFVQHIYELFTRERTTTNSGVQGTGLGMAITKNIVEAMSGRIDVKSAQGVGTTVTLTIPLKRASCHNFLIEKEKLLDPALETPEGKKILLVEDNELNQEIALAILEDEGFEVTVAENGLEAVEKIAEAFDHAYDLVLMDIQMPMMNGYEATREIRSMANKKLAQIPIIAMTANAFEEDKQNAIEAGMNGHVAKPIDPDVLFETISRTIKVRI